MRNNWYTKGLVVGIILLLIGVSAFPSTATNTTVKKSSSMSLDGNTLYVGGSGEDNYTSIQSAIGDANSGDTIFVYDDSSPYNEAIVIKKSINLIGENKETTIINGGGHNNVVYINADRVNITGFTIINSAARGIDVWGNGYDWPPLSINIYNNIISGHSRGIRISANIYGVNKVYLNHLVDNGIGIEIRWSGPEKIFLNHIENNTIGIYLNVAERITISKNNIINNDKNASFLIHISILDLLFEFSSFLNKWSRNYWGKTSTRPKLIEGKLLLCTDWDWGSGECIEHREFLWRNIDWRPARKPYDITTTQRCYIE